MDLKELQALGGEPDKHWYYRSKVRALLRLLDGRVAKHLIDVGAGSAYFSRHLLTKGTVGRVTCVDTGYPADDGDPGEGRPMRRRRQLIPGEDSSADGLLFMDVLEHVEDDAGLVRHYVDWAQPGAWFAFTVPAFDWLWSDHDVFLEHRRRYTLIELEACVARAGLKVVNGCYCFGAVLPLAVVTRLAKRKVRSGPAASQLQRHHPWVDQMLGGLCTLELPLLPFNRLGGLSALCLAVKPGKV